jgi:dihydroflavonol-4-reductase
LAGVQAGLSAVVLNPVGIFGPNDFGPSPGGEFLLQLMHRRLPGLVQAGYCWVDVRDVAEAALAAESQGGSGQRYILSSQYGSFKQIAGWVQEFSGARPPRLNVPVWIAKQAAPLVAWYSRRLGIRPLVTPQSIEIVGCHQNIVTRKAAMELDFQPRPLRETIADTVAWLRHHESSKAIVASMPGDA